MDFDVFRCKMKKRSCLFRFFSPLFTFIELEPTKISSPVKRLDFCRVFLQMCSTWLLVGTPPKTWKNKEIIDVFNDLFPSYHSDEHFHGAGNEQGDIFLHMRKCRPPKLFD